MTWQVLSSDKCWSDIPVTEQGFRSVAYRGEEGGGITPPLEIPKALQNRVKLNPIVKTVQKLLNLGCQYPKIWKKAVKF